jgi:hypothetical protein
MLLKVGYEVGHGCGRCDTRVRSLAENRLMAAR